MRKIKPNHDSENALADSINALMQKAFDLGKSITVMGEEGPFHFHNVFYYHQAGTFQVTYNKKRTASASRKGNYGAPISARNAGRLLASLERECSLFSCRDEDDEPLRIKFAATDNHNSNTRKTPSGGLDPSALVDTESIFVDFDRNGERFGMLTILYRCGVRIGRRLYMTRCDCGKEKLVSLQGMVDGSNKACGCQRGFNNSKPLMEGERFNQLTVIGISTVPLTVTKKSPGHYYLCKCDCAKEVVVSRYELTHNLRISCGCAYKPDLRGKTFGNLIVLDEPSIRKGKITVWNCLCKCGNKTYARGSHLLSGKKKGCGCGKRGPKPSSSKAA